MVITKNVFTRFMKEENTSHNRDTMFENFTKYCHRHITPFRKLPKKAPIGYNSLYIKNNIKPKGTKGAKYGIREVEVSQKTISYKLFEKWVNEYNRSFNKK